MRAAPISLLALAPFAFVLARAAPPAAPTPFRLEYHAPDVCPARSVLLQQIRARSDRVFPMENDAAAEASASSVPRFVVVVTHDAGKWRAVVAVRDEDGERKRAFTQTTCEEAVDAAGLIVALALDPDAKTVPVDQLVLPSASTSAPTPSAIAVAPPRVAPRAVEPSAPRARVVPWARLGVGARRGVTPHLVAAAALDLGVDFDRWEAYLGVERSANDAVDVAAVSGSARAQLAWTAALFGGCVLPWGVERTWSVGACAQVSLGVTSVSAIGADDASSGHPTWLALEPLLSLRLRPFEASRFVLQAGASFPLRRSHYFFDPGVDAWTTPKIGGEMALFFQLRFP